MGGASEAGGKRVSRGFAGATTLTPSSEALMRTRGGAGFFGLSPVVESSSASRAPPKVWGSGEPAINNYAGGGARAAAAAASARTTKRIPTSAIAPPSAVPGGGCCENSHSARIEAPSGSITWVADTTVALR